MQGIELGHNLEVTAGSDVWISKVLAIEPDHVAVTAPEGVALVIGQSLRLASLTGDLMHCLTSRVVQVFPELWLEPPRLEESLQRRAFVRIPDRLPLTVIYQDQELPRAVQVETADISAGGVGFSYGEALSGKLTLVLSLPGAVPGKGEQLRLPGLIRRVIPLGTRFHIGVEFLNLSEQEQDVLTQYIFRRMRTLFRRG